MLHLTDRRCSAAHRGTPVRARRAGAGVRNGAGRFRRDAETKKNPLTVDAKVLAAGQGDLQGQVPEVPRPGGLGDGPDADPDAQEDMDLTNPKRAARTPTA